MIILVREFGELLLAAEARINDDSNNYFDVKLWELFPNFICYIVPRKYRIKLLNWTQQSIEIVLLPPVFDPTNSSTLRLAISGQQVFCHIFFGDSSLVYVRCYCDHGNLHVSSCEYLLEKRERARSVFIPYTTLRYRVYWHSTFVCIAFREKR